jgi:cupin fold WbuC family metalloprotein
MGQFALQNFFMPPMRLITNKVLEQLRIDAKLTSRKRLHLNVHLSFEENPQILYNCLTYGNYMRPHRHMLDGRQEFFVCLKGEVLLVLFTDTGEVESTISMAADEQSKVSSVMVNPLNWHTLICLSEYAMLLEVKPGPFRPNISKEFALWAPKEGDQSALLFLEQAIARYHKTASQHHRPLRIVDR